MVLTNKKNKMNMRNKFSEAFLEVYSWINECTRRNNYCNTFGIKSDKISFEQ